MKMKRSYWKIYINKQFMILIFIITRTKKNVKKLMKIHEYSLNIKVFLLPMEIVVVTGDTVVCAISLSAHSTLQ